MFTQTDLFVNFARSTYLRGMAPLGAWRAGQLYRAGLPDEFRPALDFLFTRVLSEQDTRVVERVETLRAQLVRNDKTFHFRTQEGAIVTRTSQEIAQISSVTPEWGAVLYLCAKGFHAATILELGSCAGISGSYLVSAPTCREFISIERSPELATIAQTHIQQDFPKGQVVNAVIADVLPNVLTRFGSPLDLYYVDANHYYAPTLDYFKAAIPFLKPGALVIFDDIHWSPEMWEAWRVLRAQTGFSHTIDIGRFGFCVWQGGSIRPQQFNLAKYAGWVWAYAPR